MPEKADDCSLPPTGAEAPVVEEQEEPVVAAGMTWCILRAATNMESRVACAMRNRGSDQIGRVLVPTVAERRVKAGRATVVERKLYPGYVFVETALDDGLVPDEIWFVVKGTVGALGFIGDRRPTPVSEAEASTILKANAQKEKRVQGPDFKAGDIVSVTAGSFVGHEGVVEKVDEKKGTATVDIVIFGRSTPVELECWELERQL